MKKDKVTLKDIAEATNLSIATVSLVINGKGDNIPLCTKQRIFDAVREMNYRPDYTARSLATGKSHTIGVIVPDISNAFFAEMVHHLQLELNKYSYDIILCSSEEKMSNDLKYIKLLSGRNVDGLVLTMSAESMEAGNRQMVRHMLKEAAVPYIFFDRYFSSEDYTVSADNTDSGYRIANMLLDHGHRNIGVITGPVSLNSSTNRLSGFIKALQARGVELPPENIYHSQYDVDGGIAGARALLSRPNISAIFAFNDLQAFGVMHYAKDHGLRIPQDISLVGFDDTYFSSLTEPTLTSIKQPIKELAQEASKMIMGIIQGLDCPKNVKLETQIIQRNSVRQIAYETGNGN